MKLAMTILLMVASSFSTTWLGATASDWCLVDKTLMPDPENPAPAQCWVGDSATGAALKTCKNEPGDWKYWTLSSRVAEKVFNSSGKEVNKELIDSCSDRPGKCKYRYFFETFRNKQWSNNTIEVYLTIVEDAKGKVVEYNRTFWPGASSTTRNIILSTPTSCSTLQ